MGLFHRHDWKEILKTSTSPRAAEGDMSGPHDLIMKWVFGVTSIVLKCECGSIKQVEVLGNEKQP